MIVEQTEPRRRSASGEEAECVVLRVRALGQWAGVRTGGGGSSSTHPPHHSLPSSGEAGGYTVGRGHWR